ncbi:ATP/GTP-binding protein [Shewanella bicestrii]|uniref:ATP/GTP-binding protein n=1 Tax=Shewanella seohaensis TaxID=755175 RepID=A0ABV4VTV6_9GAMM
MFIRMTVENFCSISSSQTLDMRADSYKEMHDSNLFEWENEFDSEKLLNTVAIYGANASGKSNFISSLESMQTIVSESAKWQVGESLPYRPYKLSKQQTNSPTELEVEFIVENVKYLYGFSYNKERIISEWLFAYPKKKAQKWFLRVWDGAEYTWDLGRSLSGEKQTWVNSTKKNSLFLSTAVQLNSMQLKPVYEWFATNLAIAGIHGWSAVYSASQCEDLNKKDNILSLMRDVDIEVDDIFLKKEEFSEAVLPEDMPKELKLSIIKKMQGETIIEPKFIRLDDDGDRIEFDLEEESDGTNRFFAFAGPWLDALNKGKVLFVDELNSNLHPLLVKYMVKLFHCKKSNPNNAQLVFTTHETSILNQEVFRRDQIWFVQKGNNRSELYSLSDFNPRKGYENLEERYLSGSYGALPFIFKEDC